MKRSGRKRSGRVKGLRALQCLLASCSAWGCAHAPAKSGAVAATTQAAPTPDPFQLTAEFRAEEIADPEGMWLRLKSPSALLPRVLGLVNDPSLRGFADPHALAGITLGGEIASLIDFDAPLDVLVMPQSGKGGLVGAAHVVDELHFDPKKLSKKLRPMSNGRWEIRPDDGDETLHCELWHVAANVGYRVVCGKGGDAFAQGAPFLLGRLAKEPFTSAARIGASRAMFGKNFIAEAAKLAQDDMARGWLESIGLAQRTVLDLDFVEQDLELSLAFEFKTDGTAPLLEALSAMKPRNPLPPQFWQVLDEAPLAFASAGTDEQTSKRIPELLGKTWQSLREGVFSTGLSSEVSNRLINELGDSIPENYRFTVFQSGPLRAPLPPKASRTARLIEPASPNTWLLTGLAGAGARYQKAMDVLVDASNDKTNAPAIGAPAKRARFVRIAKRPTDLPAESSFIRVDAADGTRSFSWVLPSVDWVWVLTTYDEKLLFDQARRLLPRLREPRAPEQAQLDAFGVEPLLAATFSLASLRDLGTGPSKIDVEALPFGGSPRIFLRATAQRQQSGAGETVAFTTSSRWSPAAVADLVALIKYFGARGGGTFER